MKIKAAVTMKVMDLTYSPTPARPSFPIDEQSQEPPLREVEEEERHSYYEPPPQYFRPQIIHKQHDILEKISKETIIFVFMALFVGILLGKSLTPIILKH